MMRRKEKTCKNRNEQYSEAKTKIRKNKASGIAGTSGTTGANGVKRRKKHHYDDD